VEKNSMSNVVERLPQEMQSLFAEVVGAADPMLLSSLFRAENPSRAERVAVHEILTEEFSRCLQLNYEPTERGRRIDDMLGAFLLRWPVRGEWFKTPPTAGDD